MNDGNENEGIAGRANTGSVSVGRPGSAGRLGNLKLGREKDGIPGNANTGSVSVGMPGRAGSAGRVNDGSANDGIPGNAKLGRTRTGKQQLLTTTSRRWIQEQAWARWRRCPSCQRHDGTERISDDDSSAVEYDLVGLDRDLAVLDLDVGLPVRRL